jgi:hypothetical protein
VKYYNAAGTVLKTSTVPVTPGTAGHLDLSYNELTLPAAAQSDDIRASFSLLAVPVAGSSTIVMAPVCNLVATLEILDNASGKTEVVVGGMHEVEGATPTPVAAVKN